MINNYLDIGSANQDTKSNKPITIIQTPHVNNINNYHNYNINTMTINQEFDKMIGR